MEVQKVDYIDIMDSGKQWGFNIDNKDSERLTKIIDFMKQWRLITSIKEFADEIGETSVGMNDLRKGRKKISIRHITNIKKSYPYINTDFITLGEGYPWKDDYLLKKMTVDGRYSLNINFSKAKNHEEYEKRKSINKALLNDENKKVIPKEIDVYKKLTNVQNELVKCKNEIISLKETIHNLEIKLLKR